MKLYGEEKSDQEIVDFVHNHLESIKKDRRARYHGILALVPDGKGDFLDYGCGWGYYTPALAEKGYRVWGIDHSENEIAICKLVWKGRQNVTFEHKSIEDFESARFSSVLSVAVIEHVHNVGNYLSEINRVLVSGGHLVIALPNVVNPRQIVRVMSKNLAKGLAKISSDVMENYDKTRDHINAWDPFHFVRLAASVGFLFEEYQPLEGIALPFVKRLPTNLYVNNRRLRNLSYTMAFRFRKVQDKTVALTD